MCWVFVVVTALTACALTTFNPTHPLLETQPDVASANIYFIRPFTYRERGYADNPVRIDINGNELLKLGKGEYTLVRLKPEKINIVTRNLSLFTNKDMPVEMTRNTTLELVAGKTYFVHVRQVNEEFRGVYYIPDVIALPVAKPLVNGLRAAGAARTAPLDALPD